MADGSPKANAGQRWSDPVKGIILFLWIIILLLLGLVAVTDQFASRVTTVGDQLCSRLAPSSRHRSAEISITSHYPSRYLEEYLLDFDSHPPPIRAVIDRLMPNPCWEERVKKQTVSEPKEACTNLFESIHDRLDSAVDDALAGKDKPSDLTFFIPNAFRQPGDDSEKKISLPPEARVWVAEQGRLRYAAIKRNTLIDQFVLLIVLGAFGSLVFLTYKYVKGEGPGFSAFLFRPFLGMFLALAMFVIDLGSHALVSNASYREMRPETLYLLAFAGGLLSEQVYLLVTSRLESMTRRLTAADEEKRAAAKPPEGPEKVREAP